MRYVPAMIPRSRHRKEASPGRTGWWTLTVLVSLVLPLFVAPSPSASALLNDKLICEDDTIKWAFSDDDAWTTQKKSWVETAINSIQVPRDYDGSRLVTFEEVASAGWGVVEVRLRDRAADSYGLANCGNVFNPWFVINSDYTGEAYFYQVARHEMLHLVGLHHVGRSDSSATADNPVTMSTCISYGSFTGDSGIDRDSEAYLNWRYSSLANNQVSANIGFENGVNDWAPTEGAVYSAATGGATGPKYASFQAAKTEGYSYVRQTVRLWTGDDSGVELRPVINARSPGAGISTKARAALYSKQVTESGSNGCDYMRGLSNPNSVSVTANYVLESRSAMTTVGTSWTSLAGPWTSMPKRDGWVLQMRAYGNSAGSYAVWFDNVRIEER